MGRPEAGPGAPVENAESDIRPDLRTKLLRLLKRVETSSGAEPAAGEAEPVPRDEAIAKSADKPPDYLESFERDPDVPPAAWEAGPVLPGGQRDTHVRPLSEMADVESFDDDVKSVLEAVRT
jgi:cytochrome c1